MFKCKICGKNFTELPCLYSHIEKEHSSMIPKDMCVQQYYYYMKTGKTHGNCVMCKKPTTWNMNTGKYNRFCGDPKCKDEYVKIMKGRMVAKYGKTHLLNDPNKQREMLANRSISGTYEWSDGKHESTYTGSYELDFLKTLDGFFNWDPEDISMPSPHTYTYKYNGEDKFYIPDVYIHSLELEIEIKDGGDNPNNHHKIQDVDKEKERLKDEVMCSQKAVHYIKITNKNYENLFRFLKEIKQSFEKYGDEKKIPRIFKIEDIKGVSKQPVKESTEVIEEAYIRNKKDLYVNFELFDSGKINICLITGLSGSGKSTLSDELCKKYNATCIEMDMFEHPDMDFGPYSNELIFNKYFNNKPLLKQKLINNELNNEEVSLEMTNVLSYVINYCNQHPDKKFVIEGLQIFADINPDMVKGLPIVFVNTSMINSMIRKVKRDKQRYKVSDLFEWYIADEKKFNGFKKEIIEESLRDGMNNTIYNFKKFNERKYSENDLFFSISYNLAKNNPRELQELIQRLVKGARYEDDLKYVEKIVRKANDHTKVLIRRNPKLKDDYDYYYNWINKGGYEDLVKEKKRDLKESFEIIEENLFVSKENIEINIDKFGTSNNVLYITGLGGSGKSTIIKEYSRMYNAEALEFDAVTSALIRGLENLNTNKIHPIILEYLHTQKPNRLNGFSDPAFNTESVKFLDWFEKRVQGDNKLYILEGMQLFICFEPERFVNKPMVIMGTSVSKSMFRSVSRTYKRSEGDIIKTFKFFLKTLKRIPIFVKNDKQINELIDTISECYIEEKFEPDKFLVWFDKPLKKLFNQKVTLYNGSSVDKGNILTPRSVNVGATKYSDPRWSTFFWDKYEYAERWAVIWAIQRIENKPCLYQGNDKKSIIAKTKNMSDDEYIDYLLKRKQVIYIYECDVDVRKIEIGSVPSIKEYTISEEVPVDRKKKIILTKELVKRHVELMPLNDLKELMNNIDYTNHIPNVRGPILNKILSNERDDYREIVMNDVRSGKINKGDDISGYKTRINQAIKDNEFGLRESNDIIEEKFEPDKFLVWFDKPIQKLKGGKINVYHGSSVKMNGTVKPISPNVGATAYSDPRWSTYVWDNREDAIAWASAWAIKDVVGARNICYVGHNNKGKTMIAKPDDMTNKEFMLYLIEKTQTFYVYEFEIDISDLEIGSCPTIREYTVSKPMKISRTFEYKLNKEIFRRCFEIVSYKELEKFEKTMFSSKLEMPKHRGMILNNLLKTCKDPYRNIIRTEVENGNVKPGDDITFLKYSINRHFKNDSYGFLESYITDVMNESSISIPQMNYYLQNQYEEEMRNYLNTYKKYYNLMLKEQPSAVEHINEDIRKCLIVIDDLSKKEGVENNLVQFAKDDLGEIVKASKHGKPVKVFESMVDDMININDSDDIQSITVQGDNVIISNEVIECKLVYKNPNSNRLFTLNDTDSKLIIENSYVVQRDKVGSHCSITPYYKDNEEENVLEFTIKFGLDVNVDDLEHKITEGVQISNLYKFDDNFEFIRESCLKLFGVYPKEILLEDSSKRRVEQTAENILNQYKELHKTYKNLDLSTEKGTEKVAMKFIIIRISSNNKVLFEKKYNALKYPDLDKLVIKKIQYYHK